MAHYPVAMPETFGHTHWHRHEAVEHEHEHEHAVGQDHDLPEAHQHEHATAGGGELTDAHDHSHPHEQYGHSHAAHDHAHAGDSHGHSHGAGEHGHSHGLADRSIVRSRDGVNTVTISLVVLGIATLLQLAIFLVSGSVALLADLVHNFGDALTAIPLGIAFYLRSFRGEKIAGLFVVGAIFISACVALIASIERLLHPQTLSRLGVLAAAGVVGFVGNEIAAQVRLHGGRRLQSPALIADGNHARVDGFVSLSVVASAFLVWLGFGRADPLIGIAITMVILKITWDSWRVVRATEPGEPMEPHSH
jgi:Co/Zn/Cd efflux system component